MSLYQGAMLLGASLGPGVGGWLATWFGFTAPFWAYAVMAGAAACVAMISYRDAEPVAPRRAAGTAGSQGGTVSLLGAPFAAAGLINFGVFFTRTASQWQLVPLVGHERFGLDAGTLGLALTVTAVANNRDAPGLRLADRPLRSQGLRGPVDDRARARARGPDHGRERDPSSGWRWR